MDPRDRYTDTQFESSCQDLKYPPVYILVRLHRTKINCLTGLPSQVIPITPLTKTFNIQISGETTTVSRSQLPIKPAYAFTDYRAEGQTIYPIIIDIGRPPSGGISPFNIYVALSRAKGRDSIRLLQDFDEKLLQQDPNEYLHLEDERLLQLEEDSGKTHHDLIGDDFFLVCNIPQQQLIRRFCSCATDECDTADCCTRGRRKW